MWPTTFDRATDTWTVTTDTGSNSFLYSSTDLLLNQRSNGEADPLALRLVHLCRVTLRNVSSPRLALTFDLERPRVEIHDFKIAIRHLHHRDAPRPVHGDDLARLMLDLDVVEQHHL